MASINGTESTAATTTEALQAASELEAVLFALGKNNAEPADLADYQTLLSQAARRVSMLSDDAFEAEIAMAISVWFSKIGLLALA